MRTLNELIVAYGQAKYKLARLFYSGGHSGSEVDDQAEIVDDIKLHIDDALKQHPTIYVEDNLE